MTRYFVVKYVTPCYIKLTLWSLLLCSYSCYEIALFFWNFRPIPVQFFLTSLINSAIMIRHQVHQQKSAIQKVRFTKVNESIYSFLFFWKCENGRLHETILSKLLFFQNCFGKLLEGASIIKVRPSRLWSCEHFQLHFVLFLINK